MTKKKIDPVFVIACTFMTLGAAAGVADVFSKRSRPDRTVTVDEDACPEMKIKDTLNNGYKVSFPASCLNQ